VNVEPRAEELGVFVYGFLFMDFYYI